MAGSVAPFSEAVWSVFGQSTSLTECTSVELGLEHRRLPRVPDASLERFSLVVPMNRNSAWGLGIERLGNSDFSSYRFLPTYALKLSEIFDIGCRLEILRWQASDHPSRHSIAAGLFASYRSGERTTLSAAVFNPNRSPADQGGMSRTQSYARLSALYQASSATRLGAEYLLEPLGESFRFGVLYQPKTQLSIGFGWLGRPSRWTAGVGTQMGRWGLTSSVQMGWNTPTWLNIALTYKTN